MPQKNRRELYQRIRYDKNEYYPAVFVFVFFHSDRSTIGQQITGNHRLVDIESLYSHYDCYTYRPCHGFESRFVGRQPREK